MDAEFEPIYADLAVRLSNFRRSAIEGGMLAEPVPGAELTRSARVAAYRCNTLEERRRTSSHGPRLPPIDARDVGKWRRAVRFVKKSRRSDLSLAASCCLAQSQSPRCFSFLTRTRGGSRGSCEVEHLHESNARTCMLLRRAHFGLAFCALLAVVVCRRFARSRLGMPGALRPAQSGIRRRHTQRLTAICLREDGERVVPRWVHLG